MKKLFLPILILLCASRAKAQGVLYQINPPAPNAQVLVCPSPDAGYPCPVQQAIYSDVALTQIINQPVNLGSGGFLSFYVAAGTYTIQLLGPGYNSSNRKIVNLGGVGGSAVIPFAGVPTGSCTSLQQAVDTTTGNTYSCKGGVWTLIGPGGPPSGAATGALNGTYPGPTLNSKATGALSVITDCGAVGDGVTDDLAAINTCIYNNSGRTIKFPKTQARGVCDYSISGTIVVPKVSGSGFNSAVTLEGEGENEQQSTKICSSTDSGGLLIEGFATKVSGITFYGNSGYVGVTLSTYTVGTSDGIKVCGPHAYLDNVSVYNYSRHGINFASYGTGNPCGGAGVDYESSDNSIAINPYVSGNRANGIFMRGGDSNVITITGGQATGNGWFGLSDQAAYGNTIVGFETDGNHSGDGVLVSDGSLTSCATANGKISCISAAPTDLISGDLVQLLGTSNSAYNGSTFGYTPITVADSTHFSLLTGDLGPADGTSATGGTVSYYSGFRTWATAGVWGGGFYSSVSTNFFNCYSESNQPYPMITKPAIIYGGQGTMSTPLQSFWGTSATFPNNTGLFTFNPSNGVNVGGTNMAGFQFTGYIPATRRKSAQTFAFNQGNNGVGTDALFNVSAAGNGILDFYRSSTASATNGWWCFTGTDGTVGSINTPTNLCMSDSTSTIGTGQTWFPNGLWLGAPGVGGPTVLSGRSTIGSFEATAPSGQALYDFFYPDSTAHRWKMNNNNGGAFNIPGISAAGTSGDISVLAANGIDIQDIGTPTLCTGSQKPSGILPNGNATGCTAATGALYTSAPPWLRYFGDGSDGATALSGANGSILIYGTTVTCSAVTTATTGKLEIYATTSITLSAGCQLLTGTANNAQGDIAGSGGGGGGGTLAGAAGTCSKAIDIASFFCYTPGAGGGTGGASSGGNAAANAASGPNATQIRSFMNLPPYTPAFLYGGSGGGTGGSSGGLGGRGGGIIILSAPTITLASGVILDAAGQPGVCSAANSTGAGGGGGGGVIILSTQSLTDSGATYNVTQGAGGCNANPEVLLCVPGQLIRTLTCPGTAPVGTPTFTTGGFAHVSAFTTGNPSTITVDVAGTGYNYTPGCLIVGTGGGANTGSGATCTVTVTANAIASIAVSGGNAGYGTGTTYTTSGTGGYGSVGWQRSVTVQ